MLLGLVLDVVIARLKMVVDDRIGSLAVKTDLAVGSSQDDRHSFTDVIEIENTKQFVDFRFAHYLHIKIAITMSPISVGTITRANLYGNRIRCTSFEDESEIAGSRNQGPFIR